MKIFENSDFAACAKISVSKITGYTVPVTQRQTPLSSYHTIRKHLCALEHIIM